MKEKTITNTIKEFVSVTNFKGGWENGFLDTCFDCEFHWENTNENKVLLIENYLLWYLGSNYNDEYCNNLINEYKEKENVS